MVEDGCLLGLGYRGISKHIMKMKLTFLVLLAFIFSYSVFCQEVICGCDKIEIIPENQYQCKPTVFSNGAEICWQWNCDSSWLTFKNKVEVILNSCKEPNVYECRKIGLNFLKEYPNYLLFQYKWVTGCCTPPDLLFINKENGKEIKRITKDLFVWGDVDENFVLYFSDLKYVELIYLDHNKDNQYVIHFENGEVQNSTEQNQVLQMTDLFKNFMKQSGEFTFDYKASYGKTEKLTI